MGSFEHEGCCARTDEQGRTIVAVASNNAHKIVEIEAILGTVLPQAHFVAMRELGDIPEPEENGTTFEENAFIKAEAIHAATGLPTVADDSGLVVDALDGAPGVYSARYAGEHGNDAANNEKLLVELADVAPEARTARFVSCVAFVSDELHMQGTGSCEGTIGFEGKGAHGFGYDPLFLPADTPGKTMAELTPEEKNAISHRKHAVEALAHKIEELGGAVL